MAYGSYIKKVGYKKKILIVFVTFKSIFLNKKNINKFINSHNIILKFE